MKNKKSAWIITSVIGLVLLCVSYINTHPDVINAKLADYYFNKNQIQKAQFYYEKAFDLGMSDSVRRETYVNSIINAPLSLDSQEKLLKFLQYPIDDLAKLKVEYFLYDLKREIYKKYEGNFIKNAVYNQKVLRWGKMPITYAFEKTDETPEYFVREVENAINEWEQVTNQKILFEENNKHPNIIITFNNQNPADSGDKKYIVAYTSPILVTNTLKNMHIEFYLKDSLGNYFSKNQVYNTALHELVHALGFMGHSNNVDDVMYLTKDSISVSNDTRAKLSASDINTVKLLYKIKPDITNSNESEGEYLPKLVLGSFKEINLAKKKEAKIYIKNAPEISAGYIDLAESYVAEKDYAKAIKNLEKALEVSDSEELRGMIYFNLAVAYFYINNTDMAKSYLNKSLNIAVSEEKQYLSAEIYVKEENFAKAEQEYNKLIKNNPQNIEYVIALTNLYVNQQKYFKARKTLKNFIKNNPTEKNNPRFKPYGIITFLL